MSKEDVAATEATRRRHLRTLAEIFDVDYPALKALVGYIRGGALIPHEEGQRLRARGLLTTDGHLPRAVFDAAYLSVKVVDGGALAIVA
jgi:hypothetical protein